MPRFGVVIRVGPPHLFGLPDPDYQALPPGTLPVFSWSADTDEMKTEMPGGGDPYRKWEDRFTFNEVIRGMTIEAQDNVFHVTLDATGEDDAAARAAEVVLQLFHLSSVLYRPGVHRFTALVIAVFEFGSGTRLRSSGWAGFSLYDIDGLRSTLTQSATILRTAFGDTLLNQALRYFGLGDDLAYLLAKSSADDYGTSLAPIRFLQYWKALATIAGDPSADRDHQVRPKGLGLGWQYFRNVIQPLHDIRNRFGVAHIADPNSPQIVTIENVTTCREVAATVIHAYIRSLSEDPPAVPTRRAILRSQPQE